jgi:integrase/recombinase XerC
LPEYLHAHVVWLRQRGIAPTTVRTRVRVLKRFVKITGRSPLAASAKDLARWRSAFDGLAPGTISCYVSHMRSFYDWAKRTRRISRDPTTDLPVPRVPRRLPRPISEEDMRAALQHAPPRIRCFLVLAGWAGLRACEIAGLRREDVLDTAGHPLLVVSTDSAKGGRERVVPLSPFVLAELVPVLPRSGYVFRRADGKPGPNNPWRVSKLCNDFLHEMGFPETLHQCRHRFGTQAYGVSQDLRLVQELMGHQDPSTTAGYTKFSHADAIAAVAAIPSPKGFPDGQLSRSAGVRSDRRDSQPGCQPAYPRARDHRACASDPYGRALLDPAAAIQALMGVITQSAHTAAGP